MFMQHPVVALVLLIFIAAIIIKQSILKRKFLRNRLIICFIFIFFVAFLCIFYPDIKANEGYLNLTNYFLLGLDVLIGIFFFYSVEFSLSRDNFQKEILKSLDKKKIFLLVDKKGRVKEISSQFAAELGLSKEECINKKFKILVDNALSFYSLNGEEIKNSDLWEFYKTYTSSVTEDSHRELEILSQNKEGDDFGLFVVESPIFVLGKYDGFLWIGDKKSDDNLIGIEKDLSNKNRDLESLRLRFITLLDSAEEGIFFYNITDQSLWCNDSLVKTLKLSGNSINVNEYRSLIHPDDLNLYVSKLAELTETNPSYELTYRFKDGLDYCFVKESGKRIFNKGTNEICAIVNKMENGHYERSGMTELETIKDEHDLVARLNDYYERQKICEVVAFRVDNIPSINEKHDRKLGNMVLSQYVRYIHNTFVNDNEIYRVGGLDFVAIISDLRKMDLLKNYLENSEKILHVDGAYGAIKIHTEVYMGVVLSSEGRNAKDAFKLAMDCVNFCKKPQVNSNYVYYKDIK